LSLEERRDFRFKECSRFLPLHSGLMVMFVGVGNAAIDNASD